jgi:Stage II sporulation protein E (SpoIIE)
VVCRLPPAWAQLRSALRAFALADADPAIVLTGLDRLVEHGGQAEMATVAYAVLNPSDGTVVMGDAGHPPLVHLPMDGPVELVDAGPGTTPIECRNYGPASVFSPAGARSSSASPTVW